MQRMTHGQLLVAFLAPVLLAQGVSAQTPVPPLNANSLRVRVSLGHQDGKEHGTYRSPPFGFPGRQSVGNARRGSGSG